MASEVDICNIALGHIGHTRKITALDSSDGIEAEHCITYYAFARNECLTRGEFSFAKRRISLSTVGTAPDGWDYQYQRPNLCLQLIKVTASGDDKGTQFESEDHATHGSVILSNIDCAEARYIHMVTDPNKFSATFIAALGWLLAHYLAGPLAKKQQIKDKAMQNYILLVGDASARDGRESNNGLVTNTESNYKPSGIRARSARTPTHIKVIE